MPRHGKAASKQFARYLKRIEKSGSKPELEKVGADLRRFLTSSKSTDEVAAMSVAELTKLRSAYTARHLEFSRGAKPNDKGKKGKAKSGKARATAAEDGGEDAAVAGAGECREGAEVAAGVAAELEASASCDLWWTEVGSRSLRTMGYRQSRRKGLSNGLQTLGGRNNSDPAGSGASPAADWLSIRSSRSLPATGEGWADAEFSNSFDADGTDSDDNDLIGVDDGLDLSLFDEASPPPPPPRPSCNPSSPPAPAPNATERGAPAPSGLAPPGHSAGNTTARPPPSPGQLRRHQHRAATAAGRHNHAADGAVEMFQAARRATSGPHLADHAGGADAMFIAVTSAKLNLDSTPPAPPPRSPVPPPRKLHALSGLGIATVRSG